MTWYHLAWTGETVRREEALVARLMAQGEGFSLADRQALLAAATSGNPKFFLGTDSAPHSRATKECDCGCAGMYTAHAGIELYAEIFAVYFAPVLNIVLSGYFSKEVSKNTIHVYINNRRRTTIFCFS